ncbi:hypothetical protein PLESTF_001898500, partial [Pleodorina starrii]
HAYLAGQRLNAVTPMTSTSVAGGSPGRATMEPVRLRGRASVAATRRHCRPPAGDGSAGDGEEATAVQVTARR